MDEVVAEKDLPIKMAAFSHCFRTEAGAAGSATRGLYRLHQFSKVEMFVIATPEQSDALHDELTEIEQEMYTELGFHFKVLDMSSQDLGAPAYRKFDIEAWMPALGRYGEVSSASNCTDYQARRLNIKFRPEAVDGKKQPLKHVHTLNATACAVPRMIITILENFQNEDGSVDVPAPLQPFMGGVTKLTPEVVDAKKEGK
jgi:seryl-tRNA synthetase